MHSIDETIYKMTTDEKAALVSGVDFWKTNPIPRLSIPSIYMTDGPCGLRKQGDEVDHLGLNESEEATCFPTGVTVGSSWNPENSKKMGEAIAKECHHFGVNILLGPAVNIKRNPKCGRNFEYYSEDPYLSGFLGSAFVKGVQSQGIGVSLKHFAVNNNENYRFMGDSVVDERALREIYLKAFEMVVKETNPLTVMCAYNKVNGVYCSQNEKLLTDILRTEWGYKGVVVSDWGAVSDRVEAIKAGMDLEMPGDCEHFRKNIIEAIATGDLRQEDLDKAVKNILNLIHQTKNIKIGMRFDKQQHDALSEQIAIDSAVLLKNDGILPLDSPLEKKKLEKNYLVIGELFSKMRFQGGGSSLVNPTQITTPQKAFDTYKIEYDFIRGYRECEVTPELEMEKEALEKAKVADTILFFCGQTDYVESEGYDRERMCLPQNQLSLINKLIKMNKKIIVILFGGSPVELPFEENVQAILNMYLPGQAGGKAVVKLLFGEKNPSGKLAETWMKTYKDVPFGAEFVQSKTELYKESIYVGYRYYDCLKEERVRYPFGYGLSYTQFEYSESNIEDLDTKVVLSCRIQNTGDVEGAEVMQLYVANPQSEVFKAVKELRAFTKVYLKPKESKQVILSFNKKDLAYYHPKIKDWVVENGEYQVFIGASSQDIRCVESFSITNQIEVKSPYDSQKLKHYFNPKELCKGSLQEFETLLGEKVNISENRDQKFTMESRLDEVKGSFVGKLFYQAVVGVGEKQYKRSEKLPEGAERDMQRKNGMFLMKMMPNNSIRSMSVSSSGRFKYNVAEGLINILNGRIIKGLKCILKKDKLPSLPKDKQ